MKFQSLQLPIIALILLFIATGSSAQLVGDNVFLPGKYLEVGIAPNGSWGNTVAPPAGYHSNLIGITAPGYTTDPVTGTSTAGILAMDFSYDVGHDGWTAGVDSFYGPYFMPGTPFDGWAIQVNGVRSDAFFTNAGFGPAGTTLTGTNVGYTNAGGVLSGIWQGSVGTGAALSITQTTRVDTLASWAVVTTVLKNNTSSALPGVYYWVTGDPDDDEVINLFDFATDNHIVYQNDADHRVEVISRPHTLHLAAVSGLCTKDCRAKAMIYESWASFPAETAANSLDLIYSGNAGLGVTSYTLDTTTVSQDWAMGLIYNIGTIAPNDSAILSFAWIFTDSTAVDSAFPEPQIVVNGVPGIPTAPAPGAVYDTFYACANPGVSVIPVNIKNASDKNWSWSKWTWSPSLGLSSTTGVNNTITIGSISAPTTYTITGTDSSVSMHSCNNRVIYLTVYPCFSASSNSPGPVPGSAICLYDTLKLTGHGDSTGATYFWYGPAGFTSTGQSTFRTGLTMADTGNYYIVKTTGPEHDTVSTHVLFKPLPIVFASSNGPVCSGPGNTLSLTAIPDSVSETFVWTGPNGFLSGLENPSITAPPVTATGTYKVVTTLYGCVDSGFVAVIVDSTPALPTLGSNAPVCSHRDTLKFTATDATAGVTYSWSGPQGFSSTLQNPAIPPDLHVTASGTYTMTATLISDGVACRHANTVDVVVDSTPYLPLVGSNSPICSGNPLLLTATSTASASYNWAGPNSFTSVLQNPIIDPATTFATGIYSVTATITYPGIAMGCTSDVATFTVVVDSTPVLPVASSNSPTGGAPGATILCQGDTLKLMATDLTAGVSYSWAGPYAFTSSEQNPAIPNVGTSATGSFTVTATLGGCSSSAITTVTITPTPPLTATNNGPICTGIEDTMLLQAYCAPGATYSWAGPYTFSSLNQNPFRTPVIAEYGGVYQVTAFLDGCTSATVNDTVIVRQTPNPPLVAWLTYCQYYPASPLQAMGDSILWYPTDTAHGIGSPTPPVPSTTNLGVSWFYTSQTLMNCTSYIDSIKVAVNPKPVVTVSNDTSVCPHDTAVLTAVDTDPLAYYHWSPSIYLTDTSSASITVRPETNETYTVVASNQFGCSDTAHVTVTVQAAAVLNLGDSATIYPGESYQLQTQTNCSIFTWFPPSGLDNAHVSNPVATPAISTLYKVKGETSWGCVITDSISIFVNSDAAMMLPNAFSPGGSANSEFKIITRGIVSLKRFQVFDRWGIKVFETADITQGWDGTYKGKPQPFGVYVYEVQATTNVGTDVEKHGNVTLIR